MPPRKKKEEKTFDGRIWPGILQFNMVKDQEITTKSNFIFGASMLIFALIINKGLPETYGSTLVKSAWIVLLLGAFVSAFFSMLTITPSKILGKKKRIPEDIFWYKNVVKCYSRKQYIAYLKELPYDNNKIGKAYANQIYTLVSEVLPYRGKMLKIAAIILILSVLTSLVLFGISEIMAL